MARAKAAEDANARVQYHTREINRKVKELLDAVDQRLQAAKAGTADWGDVGDLAHWSEELGYLIGEEE